MAMGKWHKINSYTDNAKPLKGAIEVNLGMYSALYLHTFRKDERCQLTYDSLKRKHEVLAWALENSCDGLYYYFEQAIRSDSFEPEDRFYFMVYLRPEDSTFFNLKYKNTLQNIQK